MGEEIEGQRSPSIGMHNLDTVFLYKMRILHPLDEANAFQWEVRIGNQGLANVVTGKLLLLQEQNASALFREHRRGGRATGSTADYDRFIRMAFFHKPLQSRLYLPAF